MARWRVCAHRPEGVQDSSQLDLTCYLLLSLVDAVWDLCGSRGHISAQCSRHSSRAQRRTEARRPSVGAADMDKRVRVCHADGAAKLKHVQQALLLEQRAELACDDQGEYAWPTVPGGPWSMRAADENRRHVGL